MINNFLSVVWNADPVLLSIGPVQIRYYGIIWALVFAIGMVFFDKMIKREKLDPKMFDSIFWWGTLSTIIGARLVHCLFYGGGETFWDNHYLQNPIEILKIWEGGLASHGGAIGLLVGLWFFSRRNKVPYIWPLDRIMLVVTIGGALIRFGNLMNSEIYGVETSLPWGFIFVQRGEVVAKHPTQIYEALCYIITFCILGWLYLRKDIARKRPGLMFGVGLVCIFLSRFIIEFIKLPQDAFEADWTLQMGQWLSIPFILLGVVMTVYALSRPAVDPTLVAKRAEEDRKKQADKRKEEAKNNIKSASRK